ncbi:MAG TPA: beta-ketoacyl-ACP synthase III [Acidiphilium sp.]
MRTLLEGVGAYLPERIVTNDELATRIDTSDAWIRERTGIGQRRIAAEHETATFMGAEAAKRALAAAGAEADCVDAIIVATSTPDQGFPATAVNIQAVLGVTKGFAFDVSAACSGFVYALAIADGLIRTGQCRNVLVIGSEVYSRILNWQDRTTCVLFGDGAGAVLLRGSDAAGSRGIISTHLHSDGRYGDILYIDGATGQTGKPQHLVMSGREVFRHAVAKLAAVVDEALTANGLTHADIDWLVPHQANRRIIDAMGKRLNLRPEQVIMTVERHANTSAASIPLALAEAVQDGRIKPGNLVLLEALGGGLTWGSALIRL